MAILSTKSLTFWTKPFSIWYFCQRWAQTFWMIGIIAAVTNNQVTPVVAHCTIIVFRFFRFIFSPFILCLAVSVVSCFPVVIVDHTVKWASFRLLRQELKVFLPLLEKFLDFCCFPWIEFGGYTSRKLLNSFVFPSCAADTVSEHMEQRHQTLLFHQLVLTTQEALDIFTSTLSFISKLGIP